MLSLYLLCSSLNAEDILLNRTHKSQGYLVLGFWSDFITVVNFLSIADIA